MHDDPATRQLGRLSPVKGVVVIGPGDILSSVCYVLEGTPYRVLGSEKPEDLGTFLDSNDYLHGIAAVVSSADYPFHLHRDVILPLRRRTDGYSSLPVIGISDNAQYLEMLRHAPISRAYGKVSWFLKTSPFNVTAFSELFEQVLNEQIGHVAAPVEG